jgi:hypothetical protein
MNNKTNKKNIKKLQVYLELAKNNKTANDDTRNDQCNNCINCNDRQYIDGMGKTQHKT